MTSDAPGRADVAALIEQLVGFARSNSVGSDSVAAIAEADAHIDVLVAVSHLEHRLATQDTEITRLRARVGEVPDLQAIASAIHDARFSDDCPPDRRTSFEYEDRSGRDYCFRLAHAVRKLLAAAPQPERGDGATAEPADGGWRDIASAPKDRTPVLLQFENPIPDDREDLRRWDGLAFVGRHPGLADDGFDVGWNFAAPVGHGGFPDEWFVGWLPLPPPPRAAQAGEERT